MGACFVPGCKSGNPSKEKTHLMKISKKATAATMTSWLRNIPKRVGKDFDFQKSELCYKHFEDGFLIKTIQIKLGSTVIHEEPRVKWKLTDDAVPTIFSNDKVPKYYDRKVYARPPPKNRSEIKPTPTKSGSSLLEIPNDSTPLPEIPNYDISSVTQPLVSPEIASFISIKSAAGAIKMPSSWFSVIGDDCLEFFKLQPDSREILPTFHSERTVKIDSSGVPTITIRKQIVNCHQDQVNSSEDVLLLLEKVDKLVICEGIPNHNMFQHFQNAYRCGKSWVSDKCQVLVQTSPCKNCEDLRADFRKCADQQLNLKTSVQQGQRDKKKTYQRKSKACARKLLRIKNRLNSTRASLNILHRKFVNLKKSSLEEAVQEEDNLPPQMKTALLAAANVAKAKSKHGVRYQSDWILQSLLLKICSPKAYRLLRDNQVLPLPHPMHLTNMLRGLPCQFGFNEFVFGCLEKEFSNKPQRDRQFILLFDEMKIREAISYNKEAMRFTGYIDYGEFTNEKKNTKSKRQEADHALVFMCRSISSKLTQPIACFATRGAAPGVMLAKIIISCIMKLENVNCQVVGVISDGATTNKSAWKALGVTGEHGRIKNKIPNPFDETRDVYFFCDFPHVIKCIRNNFHKAGCVKYCGQLINWGFYQALYDIDKKNDLRIAHNLTHQHINPNPFQKMVVSYATQIFSKTVADGLRYYREVEQCHFLKNSEATEQFTRILNDVFDACNAKIPKEGVRKNSRKYKVIQDFLGKLDNEDTFASSVTLASLRVTLTSTLELIDYLCESIGFDYVLTVKFNQDCLENFFGLVRSFGGDDCHPTATSFAHLFRLLSIYMPTLKTLKGNASHDEDYSVVNYLDSLKALKKSVESKASKLSEDIDEMLLSKIIYEAKTLSDSNSNSEVQRSPLRSIVYYLCGFLVKKASVFTKCVGCLNSLESTDRVIDSALTQIKDLDVLLKYPSQSLFDDDDPLDECFNMV